MVSNHPAVPPVHPDQRRNSKAHCGLNKHPAPVRENGFRWPGRIGLPLKGIDLRLEICGIANEALRRPGGFVRGFGHWIWFCRGGDREAD